MKIAQILIFICVIWLASLGEGNAFSSDISVFIQLIKERIRIQANSECARDVRNLLYQIKTDPLLLKTQSVKKPENKKGEKDWKLEYQLAKENLKTILSGKKDELPGVLFNPEVLDSTKMSQRYEEYIAFLNKIPAEEKSKKFYFNSGVVLNPGNYLGYAVLFSGAFLLVTALVLIRIHLVEIRRWIRFRNKSLLFLLIILIPTQNIACTTLYSDKLFVVDEELNQMMEDTKKEISNYKESEKKYLLEIEALLKDEKEKESLNHFIAIIMPPIKENELFVVEEETIANRISDMNKKLDALIQEKKFIGTKNYYLNLFALGVLLFAGCISFVSFKYFEKCKAEKFEVCPRCFSKDTLFDYPSDNRYLKCTSKYCGESSFRFEKTYVKAEKLSIPIIGVSISGKTHWLANLYAQGKNLLAGDGVKTPSNQRKFRISALENSEFTKTFEVLKEKTKQLQATVIQNRASSAVAPILFSVTDGLRGCTESQYNNPTTKGLALCFDFSGEMMANEAYRETQEMVSKANGFVLFIDPFQISKQLPDLTYFFDIYLENRDKVIKSSNDTDYQIKIINNATSQYLKSKNLPETALVTQPVAICITKIDLFPHHGPLRGKYGENLVREIRKYEHRADGVSLSVIQNRSRILKKYLPIMLAKPNILEIFEKKFGDNYMLFPVANKGFDLSRNSEPFGTMEPLLWQLHMHGFDVLD
jgi:hypothetical protein